MLIWNAYYDQGVPHAHAACGSFWWKDVFSLMDIFRGITICIPRAGATVLFWKDLWQGDTVLSNSHNHLFSYAQYEDISLPQFHSSPDLATLFHLPLSFEARSELDDIMPIVNTMTLQQMDVDEWILCWGDEQFKPRKFYKFLFRNITAPTHITSIWKSKCIMRHKVFAWLMLMDRVNTRDFLLRRHFNIGEDHSCLMCNIDVLETNRHLLYECQFAIRCWDTIGIQWGAERDIQIMFNTAQTSWHNPAFKEITILASWNIWKQRNKVLFDGEVASHLDWLRMFKKDLEILIFRTKGDTNTFIQGLIQDLALHQNPSV